MVKFTSFSLTVAIRKFYKNKISGSTKFAKAPPLGLKRQANALQDPRQGLGAAGIDWCINSMFAWYISGSDKFIHDRDVAWLLKSDGKCVSYLYLQLFSENLTTSHNSTRSCMCKALFRPSILIYCWKKLAHAPAILCRLGDTNRGWKLPDGA